MEMELAKSRTRGILCKYKQLGFFNIDKKMKRQRDGEKKQKKKRERQRKRKRKRKGETILEHQTGFCCGGKCSSILIGSPAGFAKLTDNRLTGEKSYTFI